MTRTGKSPRLSRHLAEPFVEVHPKDAAALGLSPADLARVDNDLGSAILRVVVTDKIAPGHLFAPIHWTGVTAPTGRVDALVAPVVDPVSGQPDSKASAVNLAKYHAAWFGFAVAQTEPDPDCAYWAKARTDAGWRLELAGDVAPADWEMAARQMFNLPDADAQIVSDPARGMTRLALSVNGRLLAALFVGPTPIALSRDHVASLIDAQNPLVLPGRPSADMPDPGAIICTCLNVGINTICNAIDSGKALSVEALGAALGAGTNCGSCRPELAALLTERTRMEIPSSQQAAE